ncbi:MAG: hypothetical protein QOJ99_1411, partial [Bryobacterales bacterium]|nr:hypothetical protein [Bryobacterales bacterium]
RRIAYCSWGSPLGSTRSRTSGPGSALVHQENPLATYTFKHADLRPRLPGDESLLTRAAALVFSTHYWMLPLSRITPVALSPSAIPGRLVCDAPLMMGEIY